MASERQIMQAFRLTLDLCDTGVRMMRQNLRRTHPHADEREISRLLVAWLHERPGAEDGDCPGRRVSPSTRSG